MEQNLTGFTPYGSIMQPVHWNQPFHVPNLVDPFMQVEPQKEIETEISKKIICNAKKLFINQGLFIFRSLHQILNSLRDEYSLVVPFDVVSHIAQIYVHTLLADVSIQMDGETQWFDDNVSNLRTGFHTLLNLEFRVDIYGTVSGHCRFEERDRFFRGEFNGDGEFKIFGSFDQNGDQDFNEIREYSGKVILNSDLYFIMTNKIVKTLSTPYIHSSKVMKGKGTVKMTPLVLLKNPLSYDID